MKETYPVWKMFPPSDEVPLRIHYMENWSRSAGCVEQSRAGKFAYPKFSACSTVLRVEQTPVPDIATGMALVEVWYSQRQQPRK